MSKWGETYDSEVYELACTFLHETEKAILIDTHTEKLWIPLSHVKEIHRDKDQNGKLVMTAWIAKQKGLL